MKNINKSAGIPKVLKDFRLYIDGYNTGINVEHVELPKLAIATEQINMGYFTSSSIMGYNNLIITLSVLEQNLTMWKYLGCFKNKLSSPIILKGYEDNDADDDINAIEIEMAGRFMSLELGSFERDILNMYKITGVLRRFRYTINDETYFDINLDKSSFIVDGMDVLEDMRNKLGI